MVVVAPPAHRMPRSARIQSRRVPDRMAQRCSLSRPSARKPHAMAMTRSRASFQVSVFHPPALGTVNALRSGVAATRSRNMLATLLVPPAAFAMPFLVALPLVMGLPLAPAIGGALVVLVVSVLVEVMAPP